jgi:hypothetical protein
MAWDWIGPGWNVQKILKFKFRNGTCHKCRDWTIFGNP